MEDDFMDIKKVCKPRRIGKIDINTPLLVPAFSSAVTQKIADIHERLRDHISTASLVGAYDLFYSLLDRGKIWVSDVVFIDSGTYEQKYLEYPKKWSISLYMKVIDTLKPLTKAVLVNYDKKEPIKKQILNAQSLFSKYSDFATCFLCKPSNESLNLVEVLDLEKKITLIEPFNILGFTEKELGNSFLERCENLLKIRTALNDKGLTIPIHIFGCLDPLSIISYFLCGADIFDGLSWLKYSFHESIAIYVNNHGILKGSWSESDLSVRASAYVLNLKELMHLMYSMRRFSKEFDFRVFRLREGILEEVKDLTCTAGIEY